MTQLQSERMKASWARRKATGMVRKYKKRKKVKGSWSKAAKMKQSVRMKERWKTKEALKLIGASPVQLEEHKASDALTITQRLDLIVSQISRIREQIGGANGV